MAESSIFHPGFEAYNADYAKTQQHIQQPPQSLSSSDFFSFDTPSDIVAPTLDQFESDLDLISQDFDAEALQLQLFSVDSTDAFSFLRSDTPTCGPPSTITVSSESAYDSARSESYYNYPQSPYPASNYSFPIDLEMDFQRIRVDSVPDYTNNLDPEDPTSFGALPPSPERCLPKPFDKNFEARSSFSDYGPARRTSTTGELYKLAYAAGQTVAPTRVTPISLAQDEDDYKGDPRKKYKCPNCPRAFARAYNLKTHMATHDPNRLKPHVCPHRACGRSFSRKHDLGRHLISIHREESVCSSQLSAGSKKSIGVDKAARSWCDSCGKGLIGNIICPCENIK